MKTLMINGSPNERGNTYLALKYIADALEEEGIDAEICHIPKGPIQGCVACYICKESGNSRCAVDGDIVNTILEKIESADALVLGSPVYYAAPNGHLLAALDRIFFSGTGGGLFAGKPAAAICAVRRGGATATLEVLGKYLTIAGMPIAPSTYWPMIHGRSAGEVVHDEEGIQAMRMTGRTLAWMLKCIEAGKAAGISYPKPPGGEKIFTNFVR